MNTIWKLTDRMKINFGSIIKFEDTKLSPKYLTLWDDSLVTLDNAGHQFTIVPKSKFSKKQAYVLQIPHRTDTSFLMFLRDNLNE